MTKRVAVVTGATGFVGQRTVRALVARDFEVRALVRDASRWGEPTRGVTLVPFDLENIDVDVVRGSLEGAECFVHAAAYLPPSYDDPAFAETCLRVNALGTLALLEATRAAELPSFVFLSSGNVYAPQPRSVTEDDPIYPASRAPFYLASKACADAWVSHYGHARGLDTTVLRVASVYGPGMTRGGMVATFASRLRAGETVTLEDGGRFCADLVHVDDVVDATLRSVERRVAGVFNVGSGESTTALSVARTLAELLGRPESALVKKPQRDDGSPTSTFSTLDITRARSALGYAPRPLREGLESYLASLS